MLRLAAPWALLLLAPAVAAVWWMARGRRLSRPRLPLPLASARLALGRSAWVRVDRALPWVRGLTLALVVLAAARPQSGSRLETVTTFGVDIVIALDVSQSMQAEDFRPKNRLAVAKRTVEKFIEGRPNDRIGLVTFGAVASTRSPLTQDHDMLRQFLGEVDFAPREQQSTAIGMGLAAAVNRLRDSDARSKVVVLLTDGRNNSGEIGPEVAAEAARALEVRVYAVGVGTEGEAPIPYDAGPLGKRYVMQAVDLDEELLQEIAAMTDGRYFRATDADGLVRVFETIDNLEKTEVESRVRVLYTELFHWALIPAIGLLALERLLAGTRLAGIP